MNNLKKCLFWVFSVSIIYALIVYLLVEYALANSKYVVTFQYFALATYMWIPGIFALIYRKKDGIKFSLIEKPKKWVLLALLIPSVFTTLSIMIGAIFSPIKPDNFIPDNSFFLTLTNLYPINLFLFYTFIFGVAVVSALTINFFFALGEEILWRGYLWEKLKWLGFGRASFSIGIIWGLWHAPCILFLGHNYPDHRELGVLWMVVLCLLMTPVMLYVKEKGKSIAPAVVFHGMFNAIATLPYLYYDNPNTLIVTSLGLSGMLALILINFGLYPSYKKVFSSQRSVM